ERSGRRCRARGGDLRLPRLRYSRLAARRHGVPQAAGSVEDDATIGKAPANTGSRASEGIMKSLKDFEGRRPVAYLNETFLESPDARSLRILAEYLEPLSHFRDEKI